MQNVFDKTFLGVYMYGIKVFLHVYKYKENICNLLYSKTEYLSKSNK